MNNTTTTGVMTVRTGAVRRPGSRIGPLIAAMTCGALFLLSLAADRVSAADITFTDIDVSSIPVHLLSGARPNLFITLDDSQSMLQANPTQKDDSVPRLDARDTASATNPLYYDPDVIYLPPVKADGSPYPDAPFDKTSGDFDEAATRDFFRHKYCSTHTADPVSGPLKGQKYADLCPDGAATGKCSVNLAKNYVPLWRQHETEAPCDQMPDLVKGAETDSYSVDPILLPKLLPAGSSAQEWAAFCITGMHYVKVGNKYELVHSEPACPAFYFEFRPDKTFTDEKGTPGVSCSTPNTRDIAATDAKTSPWIKDWIAKCLKYVDVSTKSTQQKTNFANWYAFYRNRWRSLQSSLTQVVARLDPAVRVGYQWLDSDTDAGTRLADSLATFGTPNRGALQDWLFVREPKNDTPLLHATRRVLDLCQQVKPYLDKPETDESSSNKPIYCRNNFHLIFTDGGWDDSSLDWDSKGAPKTHPFVGNNFDNMSFSIPNTGFSKYATDIGVTSYSPTTECADKEESPLCIYADKNSQGLADLVFYSWITDLRPTDDALVPKLLSTSASDSASKQLADFWNPKYDPADWQHITTYTVGLGVDGSVDYTSRLYTQDGKKFKLAIEPLLNEKPADATWAGFPGAWAGFSNPPDDAQKVDDLWHAGINGRGGYSSVRNPQELIDSFDTVMRAVNTAAAKSAAAAPAVDSGGSTGTNRFAFQARFDSSNWTGDLLAFQISTGAVDPACPVRKGEFCRDPNSENAAFWSAAAELDKAYPRDASATGWNSRVVVTATRKTASAPLSGVVFGSALDTTGGLEEPDRQALLLTMDPAKEDQAQAVIDYLRGNAYYEGKQRIPGKTYKYAFRDRDSLLGDIINAGPVVVSAPHRLLQNEGYQQWAQDNAGRAEIVYVGANDGMLHAFAASDGEELFAYVPRPLLGNVHLLTDPKYGIGHSSFVDGPIAEGDAWLTNTNPNLSGWQSVVVGALGRGAQGVYAIRSPAAKPDKDAATKLILWDFTDENDNDMGSVLGKPAIVSILDGDKTRWVAVFGNGINSSSADSHYPDSCKADSTDTTTPCGQAALYVVDLADGKLLRKYNTGVAYARTKDPGHDGSVEHPKEPNGLSQPLVLSAVMTDSKGNQIANGDPVATVAYAGDMYGNLWRFDLTKVFDAPTGSAGDVDITDRVRVFHATPPAGSTGSQPISTQVAVAPHPTGIGAMVLFGTGRYLGGRDVADLTVQTFYGIWDRKVVKDDDVIERADLQPQYFKKEFEVKSADSESVVASEGRTSTGYTFKWATEPPNPKSGERMGWRIDLGLVENLAATPPAIDPKGERVVVAPQVRGDRVVFVSMIPSNDQCEAGGEGWVNALAYGTGAALPYTPFDYNGDGTFDSKDWLGGEVGTSIRLGIDAGIYSALASVSLTGGDSKILASDSKNRLVELLESSSLRWRVWKQIQ